MCPRKTQITPKSFYYKYLCVFGVFGVFCGLIHHHLLVPIQRALWPISTYFNALGICVQVATIPVKSGRNALNNQANPMSWLQVSVIANTDNYQQVEDTLLALGAQSITYKDAADNPILEPQPGETPLWRDAIITGLFDRKMEPAALNQAIRQQLQAGKLDIQISELPEQDWTRAWMDSFKPMRFGKRLRICPKHIDPPEPDAVNLRLDPGLAFGTGTHPTTALCLRWLDAHISEHSGHQDVLDYGCGSGVLAIAALLLGAEHAHCVDIDEQALQATCDNAETNQLYPQVTTCFPEQLVTKKPFDLVLANILSGPLTALASTLASHCHPGSDLVLSGILTSQADAIRERYAEMFDMTTTETLDDWALLHGKRKA
jgi:ribosomal protein L11 methyltransferase